MSTMIRSNQTGTDGLAAKAAISVARPAAPSAGLLLGGLLLLIGP
jgi:hypothetical protein